ncbi:hypothetical protein [Nodosilinea sp. E11]|uniref:hypothetical protein n=1 Tax=Nodosilinea sp. E11 TaxID=3037479 RepID=UPI0029342552|nr:hypothetical protein [Nodosilinea sp. E11]WOD39724.1 hypothetical protein RRF56_02805 [Nodosilinea sp. E11]
MRAKLRLELTNPQGCILAVREEYNSVMQGGAELIANLMAGRGAPITHMGVGTSDSPETGTFDTPQLTNVAVGDVPPLESPTEIALPPDAFAAPQLDETRRVVRVRIRSTLPPAAAVGTIREAGLLSRQDDSAILYNRVIFAPLVKNDDHELTLFWEVSFPYGDLQWLL